MLISSKTGSTIFSPMVSGKYQRVFQIKADFPISSVKLMDALYRSNTATGLKGITGKVFRSVTPEENQSNGIDVIFGTDMCLRQLPVPQSLHGDCALKRTAPDRATIQMSFHGNFGGMEGQLFFKQIDSRTIQVSDVGQGYGLLKNFITTGHWILFDLKASLKRAFASMSTDSEK